jgi:hypothetical protein
MGIRGVVWAQFVPWGALHVLGGVMGASMLIEDFCPVALQYRAQWFHRLLEVRSTDDPAKAATHRTTAGALVQSLRTLRQDRSTIVRNRCRTRDVPDAPTCELTTTPTPEQCRALELIQQIA